MKNSACSKKNGCQLLPYSTSPAGRVWSCRKQSYIWNVTISNLIFIGDVIGHQNDSMGHKFPIQKRHGHNVNNCCKRYMTFESLTRLAARNESVLYITYLITFIVPCLHLVSEPMPYIPNHKQRFYVGSEWSETDQSVRKMAKTLHQSLVLYVAINARLLFLTHQGKNAKTMLV